MSELFITFHFEASEILGYRDNAYSRVKDHKKCINDPTQQAKL